MSTERITRYKHDTLPPVPALRELIWDWNIDPMSVRRVVVATNLLCQVGSQVRADFYDECMLRRGKLGARYKRDVINAVADREHLASASHGTTVAEVTSIRTSIQFQQLAGVEFRRLFPAATVELHAFDHHLCHAVVGDVLCDFDDPLILTIDGFGDGFFSKAYVRDAGSLREISASPGIDVSRSRSLAELDRSVPKHVLDTWIFNEMSLGHFYSIFTWLLGFEPVCDEGKMEALAAYAVPDASLLEALRNTVRLDSEFARLVVVPDASFELYYDVPRLRKMVSDLGSETVAATMQRFLEERVLELGSLLLKRHQKRQLVLTGGVAANVVLNMKLFEEVCQHLYIVPAMADEGTAFGAAVLAHRQFGVEDGAFQFLRNFTIPYFGNYFSRSAVQRELEKTGRRIEFEDREADWPEQVAAKLSTGEIGAIYYGRMEWGPRALGHRSILANPCLGETRERLNKVVKKRPLFQPFCPTILSEERVRLFERSYENPHMTCAFRMRSEFWKDLPSAIHVDGTARVQFLNEHDNRELFRVLSEFKRRTGFGVLVNTSFNLHGRTIVNTPADAVEDFLDSNMDFLAIAGFIVRRR